MPFLDKTHGYELTLGVLSLFFYISGLFIGQKEYRTKEQILHFYKSRIIKLYIPFLLSSILSFLLISSFYDSVPIFLTSITVVAPFLWTCPNTLWFVNVLLIFYFVTPFIKRGSVKSRIIVICLLVLLFSQMGEQRLFYYFFPYLAGLFTPPQLLQATGKLQLPSWLTQIVSILSYSSMMMYMIHRQVYFLCSCVHISHFLWVPIVFVCSYVCQSVYDKGISYPLRRICITSPFGMRFHPIDKVWNLAPDI